MTNIIQNLKKGQDLSFEESKVLFNELMEGKHDENNAMGTSSKDEVKTNGRNHEEKFAVRTQSKENKQNKDTKEEGNCEEEKNTTITSKRM